MRQKTWAVLTLTFFLVFPAGGLWICWVIAHNNIVTSATPFAATAAQDILTQESPKALDDYGTLVLRQSEAEKKFAAVRPGLGGLKSVTDLKHGKSWADNPDGTMFQFVQFSGKAQFEKGDADFKFVAARRTMSPEWRIDAFELKPR